ncbi:MAG: TetR/AcrR family transcriptional regulator [Hyphomicrobiaceae bacterium]
MSIEDQRITHGRKTRTALIQAARRLFVQGYDKVGTPEIVRAAKVTRGALYHHFKDKRALFEAVVDDVARDLVGSINSAAETNADQPLEAILAGCRAFLASAQDEEMRQIFLVDAPAVLGWGPWRAIDARHGLGSLKEGLQACAEQGLLRADDIPAVAHLISGALNEVVFALVDHEPGDAMVASLDRQMERMVRALLSNEA